VITTVPDAQYFRACFDYLHLGKEQILPASRCLDDHRDLDDVVRNGVRPITYHFLISEVVRDNVVSNDVTIKSEKMIQ